MLISRVENNKPNFGAKFYHFPHAYTNPEIAKGFEKATKEYPDYVLLQDQICYFGEDQFYLLGKDVTVFDTMSLTNRRKYLNNNDVVDKLVGLFHKMLENVRK